MNEYDVKYTDIYVECYNKAFDAYCENLIPKSSIEEYAKHLYEERLKNEDKENSKNR